MIYGAALCLHENKAKQIDDVIDEWQYFSCAPPLHLSALSRLVDSLVCCFCVFISSNFYIQNIIDLPHFLPQTDPGIFKFDV